MTPEELKAKQAEGNRYLRVLEMKAKSGTLGHTEAAYSYVIMTLRILMDDRIWTGPSDPERLLAAQRLLILYRNALRGEMLEHLLAATQKCGSLEAAILAYAAKLDREHKTVCDAMAPSDAEINRRYDALEAKTKEGAPKDGRA